MSSKTIYSLILEKTNSETGKDGKVRATLNKASIDREKKIFTLNHGDSGEQKNIDNILSEFVSDLPSDFVCEIDNLSKFTKEVGGFDDGLHISLHGVAGKPVKDSDSSIYLACDNMKPLATIVGEMYGSDSTSVSDDIIKRYDEMPTYYNDDAKELESLISEEKKDCKIGKRYPLAVSFGNKTVYIPAEESKLYHLPFLESSLKVFGKKDDKVIVIFSKKDGNNNNVPYLDNLTWEANVSKSRGYIGQPAAVELDPPITEVENTIAKKLRNSKNIILHGAPGTGKTYMARRIAEYIAGDRERVEFVQFHPSYDYTDFVEGLRPVLDESSKLSSGDNVEALATSKDVPENDGKKGSDIKFAPQDGIFKKFVKNAKKNPDVSYVFIIDEINRGEISKIFGELFFSIDPEYRVTKEALDNKQYIAVSTQYANINGDEKFYIPDNVYIIGTMNDIDRSVDSFDFAMRRRFRFIEVTAEQTEGMLEGEVEDHKKAQRVMRALNDMISGETGGGVGLDRSYEVGPSYFLKLKELDNDYTELWNEYIEPLLKEYLRGTYRENENLQMLENAYEEAGVGADKKPNERRKAKKSDGSKDE